MASWSLRLMRETDNNQEEEWVDNVILGVTNVTQETKDWVRWSLETCWGAVFNRLYWVTAPDGRRAVLSLCHWLLGGGVGGVDLLFEKWHPREQETLYLPVLLFSTWESRGRGGDWNDAVSQCAFLGADCCLRHWFWVSAAFLWSGPPPFFSVHLEGFFFKFILQNHGQALSSSLRTFLKTPPSPMWDWLLSPFWVSITPFNEFC